MVPVECVARGYLTGGGFAEYRRTGAVSGVELPRGALTQLLYGAARDDVEFLFGDTIATLEQDDDGVDVTLASGARRRVAV